MLDQLNAELYELFEGISYQEERDENAWKWMFYHRANTVEHSVSRVGIRVTYSPRNKTFGVRLISSYAIVREDYDTLQKIVSHILNFIEENMDDFPRLVR